MLFTVSVETQTDTKKYLPALGSLEILVKKLKAKTML